ncbi:MAG TPA: Flp pilus assembly protein CpaB [Stellaceae bacterium]|nr:Flp pilus assembly protein CpaB [Stellaceae bacterium]
MSPRRIIFIVIALLASGATILIGRAWLTAERAVQVEAAPAPPKPATMILVARGELHSGQFVRPENLRWQAWPDDAVSQSYILSTQNHLEDYVGAVVRNAIGDGEPITESRVVRPGDRGFLAAVLTPGYRAVTVPVTPSSGLAGFVFPGDHVDVILSFTLTDPNVPSSEKGDPAHIHHTGETVLSDVRVLALDQRADDQSKEVSVAKTATLEVTPKQAEAIAVVQELGKLSLSLRSLGQDEAEASGEAANNKLSYTFDSDATQLTPPPEFSGNKQKVIVVRGDKVEMNEFSKR